MTVKKWTNYTKKKYKFKMKNNATTYTKEKLQEIQEIKRNTLIKRDFNSFFKIQDRLYIQNL